MNAYNWQDPNDPINKMLAGDVAISDAAQPAQEDNGITSTGKPGTPQYDEPLGPEPPSTEPSMIGSTFNPNTMAAQKYGQQVREYQGNRMAGEQPGVTYKDPSSGRTMNVPQQYGQDGTPADPDEGPLTPEETAKRMPSDPGEMEKRINQHTLGYGLGPGDPRQKKRQEGYQSYVQASQAADDQRRVAQRERAKVNRADIDQRDERTATQMQDYNAMQGGGGTGGAGQGGPYTERMGGITFLRGAGHYRPQSTQEAAESRYKNAQADLITGKPEAAANIERLKNERAAGHDETKKSIAKMNAELRERISKEQIADRAAHAATAKTQDPIKISAAKTAVKNKIAAIKQILEIKMEQGKKVSGIGPWAKADPSMRDSMVDPTTKQVGEKAEGDFDFYKQALKNEMEHLQILDPTHEHDSDFIKFIEEINQ